MARLNFERGQIVPFLHDDSRRVCTVDRAVSRTSFAAGLVGKGLCGVDSARLALANVL